MFCALPWGRCCAEASAPHTESPQLVFLCDPCQPPFSPPRVQVFATSSTDTCVRVWDVRRLGPTPKPVAEGAHRSSCQAAHFAPDGAEGLGWRSWVHVMEWWEGLC